MKAHIATAHMSMLARQSCYAAMLLGYLTSPLVAQEPASAPGTPTTAAPSYKVGDTWTFIWGRTDSKPGTPLVLTVVAVTETQTLIMSGVSRAEPLTSVATARLLRSSGYRYPLVHLMPTK